ncbi:MAG: galactokinase [Candidatus Planktophila sp.]
MSEWLQPEVIASAPGRVNIIGEHIDFSEGFVLPFAIADRTVVKLRRRSDSVIRLRSLQQPNDLITTHFSSLNSRGSGDWERYVLGVIWSLHIESGVDIEVDGQVPLGAGLSSSAALECAVATGLNHLFALGLSKKELALLTQRAENEYVGMPCGIMDQSVSLMAEAGSALLLDCRDLSTKLVPFDLAKSQLELLVIDTQVHHALVDGGYAERRSDCESAVSKLGIPSLRELSITELNDQKDLLTEKEYLRARHAVNEIARVRSAVEKLQEGDFLALGALITASHISLRDDYDVSCPELNCAVDTALSQGALGARMIGGGFGGSAIALVSQALSKNIQQEISEAFAAAGFRAPRFFTSLPSDGARIESIN